MSAGPVRGPRCRSGQSAPHHVTPDDITPHHVNEAWSRPPTRRLDRLPRQQVTVRPVVGRCQHLIAHCAAPAFGVPRRRTRSARPSSLPTWRIHRTCGHKPSPAPIRATTVLADAVPAPTGSSTQAGTGWVYPPAQPSTQAGRGGIYPPGRACMPPAIWRNEYMHLRRRREQPPRRTGLGPDRWSWSCTRSPVDGT